MSKEKLIHLSPVEQDEQQPKKKKGSMLGRICTLYDKSFTSNLALTYINGGFKALYSIALQSMFKKIYNLTPNQLQIQLAFILFPWDFKILYGIISDTVMLPCFPIGSRKGWLVIFSLSQTALLLVVSAYEIPTYEALSLIFFFISLCSAFLDTTVDAVACA